jgi:hypothetical protein
MSGLSNRGFRRALVAGVTAMAVVASLVVIDGGPGAAAADKPLAQSVGRFLDGSIGGKPLQDLADVKDARAVNPGTTSAQNPLDVTLLGQLELPLSGALQLPGGGVFKLGAVNQVAQAKSDGYSFGASGAVSNSGGISLGGSTEFPADATIDLSDAALGSVTIPGLPTDGGDTTAAALGGVQATIGAVSALAQTKAGGDPVTPQYQIAELKLALGSPALGALLGKLAAGSTAVNGLIKQLTDALKGLNGLPGLADILKACDITSGTLPGTLTLAGGGIVIDPATAAITLDLATLLAQAGLNLNKLPANTDLIAFLLGNLGRILSHGLESLINGIINPLQDFGSKCLDAITGSGAIGQALGGLLDNLKAGQKQFEDAINKIADQLSGAGAPGLKALTDALGKVAKIGVNVESGPGKAADSTQYKFTSALAPTPDQATPVVQNQTLVRAIEIDLLGGQLGVLALANAAAGPSTPAVIPPTTTPAPTTTVPGTALPTGVPAGRAETGGTPTLPIVLLLLGLMMAAGGAATWRLRGGKHSG